MTTQLSDSSEAKDSTKYKLGDLVRATKALFAAATDELPAQDFCNVGDTLEIRKIAGFWPYSVAHPNREAGVMFGVNEDEIEPLSDLPPAPPDAAPRSEPLDAASRGFERWLLDYCKIVYYDADYPIEHNAEANKDGEQFLRAEYLKFSEAQKLPISMEWLQ